MTSPTPPREPSPEAAPTRRTLGIALMAIALFVVSLVGLVSSFMSTEQSLGFEQPAAWRALLAGTSVLGIWAGWESWRLSRHAGAAYLLWSAAGTAATIYWIVVLAPTMIAIGAEIVGLPEPPRVSIAEWAAAVAVHVGLLALGWWYLRLALGRRAGGTSSGR